MISANIEKLDGSAFLFYTTFLKYMPVKCPFENKVLKKSPGLEEAFRTTTPQEQPLL
jgi:hypothetical protein